jgi:hypothetical protein
MQADFNFPRRNPSAVSLLGRFRVALHKVNTLNELPHLLYHLYSPGVKNNELTGREMKNAYTVLINILASTFSSLKLFLPYRFKVLYQFVVFPTCFTNPVRLIVLINCSNLLDEHPYK